MTHDDDKKVTVNADDLQRFYASLPSDATQDEMLIVNADGTPRGMVDFGIVQSTATVLMYALAAAAGNDDEVDRVASEFLDSMDEDSAGLVSCAALSLLTRCVLAPLLEVLDRLNPGNEFRQKLAESRDSAAATLGGGAA